MARPQLTAWDVASDKVGTYHNEVYDVEPSVQPPVEEATWRKLVQEEQLCLWEHRPRSGLTPFFLKF